MLNFGADNVPIGDKDAFVLEPTYGDRLSSALRCILKFPEHSGEEPRQEWIRKEVMPWFQAWNTLSSLRLVEYIQLLALLPKPFVSTELIHPANLGGEHYQRLRCLYMAKSRWMLNLTDHDGKVPKPQGLGIYESFAWQSNARLNVGKAVYNYQDDHFLFQRWIDEEGLEHAPIFSGSGHLWFFGEIANCIRLLKQTGMSKPLLPAEVRTKPSVLKDWTDRIAFIEQGSKAPQNRCQGWEDLLEHVDLVVLSQAMCGKYTSSTGEDGDSLDTLIQVERWAKSIVKTSDNIQVVSLWSYPTSSSINTFITKKGRTKPKENKVEGFKPKRARGRPVGTFKKQK